ncbi:paraquat-inducible protein B [Escherichia coli]|nr:paraquat-inducible protein B [Escherichia coli]
MESNNGEAKIQKVKNWSPVWIFPIVTALIGAWVLFYHYSHQGRGSDPDHRECGRN